MSKKKREAGPCVYCNEVRLLTVDHVPPRNLFAKDNRHGLIRVPACDSCNTGFAKDDEYLRLMLAMRHDVDGVPDAKEAMESNLRALARPDKKKLLQATLRNIKPKDRFEAGLYLGPAPAYNVDLKRLNKSAERITLGLFWHRSGHALPAGYSVTARALDGFDLSDLGAQIWVNKMSDVTLSGGISEIGGGAFRYAVVRDSADPNVTLWMFQVYQRVFFFCVTKPDEPSSTQAA